MFSTESIYDYLKRNNCSSEELAKRFTVALNEATAKREKEELGAKQKHKDALAIVNSIMQYMQTHFPEVYKYFDEMDRDDWADTLVDSFDKTNSMITMVKLTPMETDDDKLSKFLDNFGF